MTTIESIQPAALSLTQAAAYLSRSSRWLRDPACPVPRVDLRQPGAGRPVWRWLRSDLDAWLETRRVPLGHFGI